MVHEITGILTKFDHPWRDGTVIKSNAFRNCGDYKVPVTSDNSNSFHDPIGICGHAEFEWKPDGIYFKAYIYDDIEFGKTLMENILENNYQISFLANRIKSHKQLNSVRIVEDGKICYVTFKPRFDDASEILTIDGQDIKAIIKDQEESPLIKFAKEEMQRLWPEETREDIQKEACNCVLDLIETFSKQSHSGLSGNYVLNIFEKLVRFKPISPLTGNDDEWNEVDKETDFEQNKRCGSVFRKNHDNSTAYNIEGNVFVDQDGVSFTNYMSKAPVVFPYTVPDKPNYVKIYSEN